MSLSSSYFDSRHTGGAVASTGMSYQDLCAVLIAMKHWENVDFSSIGLETSNDITLCIGVTQKHIQTKDRRLTPGLLKTVLEGAVLDRQDILIIVSSTNEEVDSLFTKLTAYRSHQAHALNGGPEYLAVEKDFNHELSLAGCLELKEVLLKSEVWVVPSYGLEAVVEAELSRWARARQSFISEKSCLLELCGTFSHARSNRLFLSRAELTTLLSQHMIDPSLLMPLMSAVRPQLDSPQSFRLYLRRQGDVAARLEQKLVLAEEYESQRDFRGAFKLYQALAVVLNDSEWLLIRCAALCELLEDLPQAEDYARQALQLNSNAFGALCVLATVAAQKGQLDDALGYFRVAERINNEDASLLHNIGYTLLCMGNLGSALDYFEKAAARPDALAASHLNAGVVHYQTGRYEDAEKALESALRLEPNMPEALSQLGELHRFFGRLDVAVPMLNRALRSLPNNGVAKRGLAISMLETGDAEGAQQLVAHLAEDLKGFHVGAKTLVMDIGWSRTFAIQIIRTSSHCFDVKCGSLAVTVKTADTGTLGS